MKTCYVVMGVSGSGKTTIGKKLAKSLQVPFFDADDFHPETNVQKMSAGHPLNDGDRLPWLHSLHQLLKDQESGAVLACSALKKSYRTILRKDLFPPLQFIFLKASQDFLFHRMNQRKDHFMPASLLDSQFATLEEPQNAWIIDGHQSQKEIIARILKQIPTT